MPSIEVNIPEVPVILVNMGFLQSQFVRVSDGTFPQHKGPFREHRGT